MKGCLDGRTDSRSRCTINATLVVRNLLIAVVLYIPVLAEEQTHLAQFVRDSVAANNVVLAAEAMLNASNARRMGTLQSYDNPELFIDMEELDPVDGEVERRTVIGMAKRFDLHGKRKARITVAEADELVVRAELDDVRTETATQLLNSLARWQSTSNKVDLLRTHELNMADFLLLSERQLRAGDISQMEADLVKLAKAKASMNLAVAQTELATAVEGVQYRSHIHDERVWPEFEFELQELVESEDDSVATLPDVRAALLEARVASAEVDVVRRNLRPDPTVTLGIGEEAGERLAEIGVSVPLNVLNRGSHGLSAAMADANAAARTAADVTRRARVRLEASAERYRVAYRTWNEWLQEGARSVADREALAKRSWEAGELEPAEYLVHLDAALELKVHSLDLRQTVWLAWIEWLSASQNLDDWLGIDTKGGGA